MLVTEARVETGRSSRYLMQLCSHIQMAGAANPEMKASADWSDTLGLVRFDTARCTLRAEPDALRLKAEAQDEPTLQWIQSRVAARLEQIGRRDQLHVVWTR